MNLSETGGDYDMKNQGCHYYRHEYAQGGLYETCEKYHVFDYCPCETCEENKSAIKVEDYPSLLEALSHLCISNPDHAQNAGDTLRSLTEKIKADSEQLKSEERVDAYEIQDNQMQLRRDNS